MSHDGRAIANFVLDRCEKNGRLVTNLALQKIVYFCHVWFLSELQRPLVKHKFEAWEFGPVLPYLYREFRNFDRAPIKSRATQIDHVDGTVNVVRYEFDQSTHTFLANVVDFYSQLTAGELVELSHVEGGPWHRAWFHRGTVNPGMKIEDATISDFYSKESGPFSIQ